MNNIYQEEEGETFESDGVFYDLNKILLAVAQEPIKQIGVDKIKWVLRYTTPDQERVKKVDITTPILVTRYGSLGLVVDGLHRLQKAVNEKVRELPFRRVSPEVMKAAVIRPIYSK